MAVFKCKMCGGTLEIDEGQKVAVCEYCGTKQTLPNLDDDRKANLYDRANHFRRNNEFDKAMSIYEQILSEDTGDAEAYWSLVLCRYGIEYVEDPSTHKRVPTVNRAQYTSIFDDDNYKSAIEHADGAQKAVYEEEASTINEIQKGILAISQKEEPFDVFICYKETDQNGRRTPDSVLATDLYHQLTQEDFKVFFSRITLEDKLGHEYEPYIFAALNSAKVMVVMGTKPEYFSAVWVKNEWSRYLALVKNSGGKKLLIPAYKDMDPYDLPDEFSHLQAQDMGKLGFMQDLIRGIKKILAADEPKATVKETVVVNNTSENLEVAPLLKRAFMYLEDEEWDKADEYAEKVLDREPENAEAYLAKLMAELGVRVRQNLKNCSQPFDDENSYKKAYRFGNKDLKKELENDNAHIRERNEHERLEGIYNRAQNQMNHAHTEGEYKAAANTFESIKQYRDSENKVTACLEKAEIARKDTLYDKAKSLKSEGTIKSLGQAINYYQCIPGWKDAGEQIEFCKKRIKELEEQAEIDRKNRIYNEAENKINSNYIPAVEKALELYKEISDWKDSDEKVKLCEATLEKLKKKAAIAEKEAEEKAKKQRTMGIIAGIVVVIAIAFVTVLTTVVMPSIEYNNALALMEEQKYDEAIAAFEALDGYKDSAEQIQKCKDTVVELENEAKYNEAVALMNDGNIIEAYDALTALGNYKDSKEKADSIYDEYKIKKLKEAKAGDYVFFGSYEQDNDISNGKEKIEWLVLDKKDGRILVISKYALDCQSYNKTDTDVTWKTCSFRTWLNNDFLNSAFSDSEKAMIPTVTVSADKNPEFNTNPGNATQDKVFLLSITEAHEYFSNNSERQCKPTEYAKAQGAGVGSSNGNCWWWLRSPGDLQINATCVSVGGEVSVCGIYVRFGDGAVRPAMWIDVSDIE